MNIENNFKIPFLKASLFFAGLYFAVAILYAAQNILVPLIYSVFFAILLRPFVGWLTKKNFNKVLAISIVLVLATAIIVSLGFFIFFQASHFAESLPELIDKLQQLLNNTAAFASRYFHMKEEKTDAFINSVKADLLRNASIFIGNTIASTGKILLLIVLIPVYVFMLLFYQPLLLSFIHKISGSRNLHLGDIFLQTKSTIMNYLKGLLIEAAIVAVLNSTGLLILGIDYAIFLGVLGALLNFIPYLGAVIASGIYMLIALITKDSFSYVLWILLLFLIVQAIDNNFIVPKIVGAKVKINALTTFMAVILGGALWGIHGMFLSIPIIAIVKIVADRIEPLKPFGYLMGEKNTAKFI